MEFYIRSLFKQIEKEGQELNLRLLYGKYPKIR